MIPRTIISRLSINCAVSTFLLLVLLTQNNYSQSKQKNTDTPSEGLSCSWAFVGASPAKKGWTIFPIVKDTALQSGDNLLVYFDPTTECYCYVFLHDSENKIHLLFPSSEKEFGSPLKKTERYIIPQQGSGLELDESKGAETFYFIVSASRLLNIEGAFIKTHLPSPGKNKNYIQAFLSELRSLSKDSFRSYASIAEIPPSIAGTFRGKDLKSSLNDIDFERYAVEISGKQIYIKKIVIQHR